MYPIKIRREPRKVRYNKVIELDNDGVFTLSEIRNLVTEDERFSIIEKENSMYGSSYALSVTGERFETQEEVDERVAKEELYMDNYTKFHANKPVKTHK
jgi:hypothetical protein